MRRQYETEPADLVCISQARKIYFTIGNSTYDHDVEFSHRGNEAQVRSLPESFLWIAYEQIIRRNV